MPDFMSVEDLHVYRSYAGYTLMFVKFRTIGPGTKGSKLTGQVRRSSNSAPAQLAEKHDDRHVRNKIEGANGSRGEVGETIHHLYMARLKHYIETKEYQAFKDRYKECIRMLNGMERTLEKQLPERTAAGFPEL